MKSDLSSLSIRLILTLIRRRSRLSPMSGALTITIMWMLRQLRPKNCVRPSSGLCGKLCYRSITESGVLASRLCSYTWLLAAKLPGQGLRLSLQHPVSLADVAPLSLGELPDNGRDVLARRYGLRFVDAVVAWGSRIVRNRTLSDGFPTFNFFWLLPDVLDFVYHILLPPRATSPTATFRTQKVGFRI